MSLCIQDAPLRIWVVLKHIFFRDKGEDQATQSESLWTLQLKCSRLYSPTPYISLYFSNALWLLCLAVCFATQRQAMSRRIFHCSHSNSASSAVGAKMDDEDDAPSIFSTDFASEDAQPCAKKLKIKGQSAAPQPRGHNSTRKQ